MPQGMFVMMLRNLWNDEWPVTHAGDVTDIQNRKNISAKHLITKDRLISTIWIKKTHFCLKIVYVNLIIRRISKLVPICLKTSVHYIMYIHTCNIYPALYRGSHSKFLLNVSLCLNTIMAHDENIEHNHTQSLK